MKEFIQNNVFTFLFMLVVLLVFLLLIHFAFQSTMNDIEWREEVYVVKKGDSLWKISGLYCPDSVDRREWINEVQELNGLEDSVVYPGQRLTVLAPGEEG